MRAGKLTSGCPGKHTKNAAGSASMADGATTVLESLVTPARITFSWSDGGRGRTNFRLPSSAASATPTAVPTLKEAAGALPCLEAPASPTAGPDM